MPMKEFLEPVIRTKLLYGFLAEGVSSKNVEIFKKIMVHVFDDFELWW